MKRYYIIHKFSKVFFGVGICTCIYEKKSGQGGGCLYIKSESRKNFQKNFLFFKNELFILNNGNKNVYYII